MDGGLAEGQTQPRDGFPKTLRRGRRAAGELRAGPACRFGPPRPRTIAMQIIRLYSGETAFPNGLPSRGGGTTVETDPEFQIEVLPYGSRNFAVYLNGQLWR